MERNENHGFVVVAAAAAVGIYELRGLFDLKPNLLIVALFIYWFKTKNVE